MWVCLLSVVLSEKSMLLKPTHNDTVNIIYQQNILFTANWNQIKINSTNDNVAITTMYYIICFCRVCFEQCASLETIFPSVFPFRLFSFSLFMSVCVFASLPHDVINIYTLWNNQKDEFPGSEIFFPTYFFSF